MSAGFVSLVVVLVWPDHDTSLVVDGNDGDNKKYTDHDVSSLRVLMITIKKKTRWCRRSTTCWWPSE